MGRIIVVGYQGTADESIFFAVSLLKQAGCFEWAESVSQHKFECYDMKTNPDNGDAIDHIDVDVDLVVALNICGMRGQAHSRTVSDQYNVKNIELYQRCIDNNTVLVDIGQFPTPDIGFPTIGMMYVGHLTWWPGAVENSDE